MKPQCLGSKEDRDVVLAGKLLYPERQPSGERSSHGGLLHFLADPRSH